MLSRVPTKTRVFLALLALLWIVELRYVPLGLEILDSDYAILLMIAKDFREGKWATFPYDLPYAGTAITLLRAGWSAFWEQLDSGPNAYWQGHMVYTYLIVPGLLFGSTFWLLLQLVSLEAATFACIPMVVGLPLLRLHYPNDVYMGYLVFGFWLLGLQAKYGNPLCRLRLHWVFSLGILSGFFFYTSKVSALFTVAFSLSFFTRPPQRPNTRELAVRIGVLLLGAVIGFLPEILFLRRSAERIGYPVSGRHSVLEALSVLAHVPLKLREVFASGGDLVLRNAIVFLVLAGLFQLVVETFRKRGQLLAVTASAILSLGAFSVLRTVSGGAPRYLFPLLPAIFVGLGLLWERARKSGLVGVAILVSLMTLQCGDQFRAMDVQLASLRSAHRSEAIRQVVEAFRQKKVKLVLVDDYWYGNVYSFIAKMDPVFFPAPESLLKPPLAKALVRSETEVGVSLSAQAKMSRPGRFEVEGHRYLLTYFTTLGGRDLFLGSRD